MRKGFGSSCNGDGSTSTLNQCKTQSLSNSPFVDNTTSGEDTRTTLEEMILQLEFEEKMARKAKADEYRADMEQRRMSCVDNSDILRSARNALNQYPRFSLDGKDSMYRSSFRNLPPLSTAGSRKSFCGNPGLRKGIMIKEGLNSELRKTPCFPPIVAGESVVWCKPGVVAKLMGLEAIPVPVGSYACKEKWSSVIKKQNLRKRAERHELERRKLARDINGGSEIKRGVMGSCSRTGYCVMKPIAVDRDPANDGAGWPIRGFR
ncbi:hypothetical protein Vadar_003075 [Vaccinium darrowii]|uniref:Uncharacterized protein n=1 Tax=Vaccinium darrowii TaxID=229202 RepID=A0ACB7YSE6_9ERIC|nr:hypothetical protein Vadar_003075 [Vaccinium darrowii]